MHHVSGPFRLPLEPLQTATAMLRCSTPAGCFHCLEWLQHSRLLPWCPAVSAVLTLPPPVPMLLGCVSSPIEHPSPFHASNHTMFQSVRIKILGNIYNFSYLLLLVLLAPSLFRVLPSSQLQGQKKKKKKNLSGADMDCSQPPRMPHTYQSTNKRNCIRHYLKRMQTDKDYAQCIAPPCLMLSTIFCIRRHMHFNKYNSMEFIIAYANG